MATTATEIRESIINVLSDIADSSDLESLKDDVPFRDQLELDSMDMLDVVLGLRKLYQLPIPETDYPQLQTMNSTIEYLLPLLNK
ncbi:MAG: acyl carrier protein [Thermoguttaceae bacterium]|nr:acyl carrier protein [Thermoguttaceae bacterium]